MLYAIVLSVVAGALGLYYFLFKDMNFFKRHGIPHVKPLPLLGNLGPQLFRRQSITDFVESMYNVHPDAKYVGMYSFNQPIVVIRDVDLVKSIAVKYFNAFSDHRSFIDESQDPLLGKNLVSLRGERWREVRSILSPAFTSSKMKSMFKLMSECGVNFVNYVVQLPPDKRIMDTKDAFTRYTTDVIATCAFGVSVDSMRNPKNEFYMYGKEMTTASSVVALLKFYALRYMPYLSRILQLRVFPMKIANFFQDLVQNTVRIRDEKGIARPDMLQLMMESRGKEGKTDLTIEDMVSQAFVFFFGGFETSSTLICFAAHEIAVNRGIQGRLQSEIDKILEDSNGEPSYEAIQGMEYLDAVINETLRMYPVGVALERMCVKNFELPPTLPGTKPFTVREGQSVWVPVYGLQHDSKYFEEPKKFDPERFLGERKKNSFNCGAYLPFGLGPRMCIGNRFALLETKVLFFHLLARCNLEPCEKTLLPLKIATDSFSMKPKGGFWLNIVPRKVVRSQCATGVP